MLFLVSCSRGWRKRHNSVNQKRWESKQDRTIVPSKLGENFRSPPSPWGCYRHWLSKLPAPRRCPWLSGGKPGTRDFPACWPRAWNLPHTVRWGQLCRPEFLTKWSRPARWRARTRSSSAGLNAWDGQCTCSMATCTCSMTTCSMTTCMHMSHDNMHLLHDNIHAHVPWQHAHVPWLMDTCHANDNSRCNEARPQAVDARQIGLCLVHLVHLQVPWVIQSPETERTLTRKAWVLFLGPELQFELPLGIVWPTCLLHETFVSQALACLESIMPPKTKLQSIKHFRMLPRCGCNHALQELAHLAGHKHTGAWGNDNMEAFLGQGDHEGNMKHWCHSMWSIHDQVHKKTWTACGARGGQQELRFTSPCLEKCLLGSILPIQMAQHFLRALPTVHVVVVRLPSKRQHHLAGHGICFRILLRVDFEPWPSIQVARSFGRIANGGPHAQLFLCQSSDCIRTSSIPGLLNRASWDPSQDLKGTLTHSHSQEGETIVLLHMFAKNPSTGQVLQGNSAIKRPVFRIRFKSSKEKWCSSKIENEALVSLPYIMISNTESQSFGFSWYQGNPVIGYQCKIREQMRSDKSLASVCTGIPGVVFWVATPKALWNFSRVPDMIASCSSIHA